MTVGVNDEFDRQMRVMLAQGYPALAGMTADAFVAVIEPLRPVVADLPHEASQRATNTGAPWLLVVSPELVPAEALVPLLQLPGGDRPGVVDRNHGDDPLHHYRPLPELRVPDAPAYVVVDIDRGDEFRGVRPRDAVPAILGRGRTPLTIHEGLALATQHPAALEPNHCFMLAGSRRGDKRVPALWISERAPKLGWCWDGNLHTWLGIASAGGRRAAESPA